MTEGTPDPERIEPPDLGSWLLSYLGQRRSDYEEQFSSDDAKDEGAIERAFDRLERHAMTLVTTGVIPAELESALAAFSPADSMTSKIRELLQYRIIHHRLEFDIADEVCGRLNGLDERVSLVAVFTILLLGYKPSDTALKYFQRATLLFLAGYEAETIVMCGAVLEAALRARFPDEVLEASGIKPIFKRTSDYSIGQRLNYEERHPIFSASQRKEIRDLLSWRNDAIHVQPDISPRPLEALAGLTLLLPVIFPANFDGTGDKS